MTVPVGPRLTSSGSDVLLGSTLPRLWTRPLVEGPPGPCVCGCALTEESSYGFDVIFFAAEVLGTPLDPWEEFAAIHAGEMLPDGRPRFRKLLIIVARQQGKTLLCRVLTLYWQFIERWPMVLATSTNLGYAKISWLAAVALAESVEDLAVDIPKDGVRKAAGEECLTTAYGAQYRIAASNRKGGRSLTVDRLVLDELREHQDWSAWGAAYNAMSACPHGQVVAITNMGDSTAVVLDSLRNDALAYIENGGGDYRLGLLEWSAPSGADPEDPHALAQSCPNLGRRTALEDLLADARRAKTNGGEELATFKTEIMCQKVPILDPAIDPDRWVACLDIGDMTALKSRMAWCLDVAPDRQHATLVAAAVLQADPPQVPCEWDPDRVRVEVVKAWSGPQCTRELKRDLPGLVAKHRPKVIGWYPQGPGAALAAELADRKRSRVAWPPAGVRVEEIKQDLPATCMGFAEMVESRQIAQSDDPLLNAQVIGAERLHRGNSLWVFTRRGAGHVDGTYAAAGATHLARTLPTPPSLKVISSKRRRAD